MRWPLVMLAVLATVFVSPAAAPAPYDNESTGEGWAWARIQNNQIADLNLRCDPSGKTSLDPHNDAGRDDDCRRIGAKFVTDVLTDPQLKGQIKRHGARLRGARIAGSLDLNNAEVGVEVWINASRIGGVLSLRDAHLAHVLSLEGTQISGHVNAEGLHADSDLFMRDGALFKGDVDLAGAKIDGQLAMNGSTFEQAVNGDSLHVDQHLFMNDKATFKGDVDLRSAKIGGRLDMDGSTFEQAVDGGSLQVGQSLFMRRAVFHKPISLIFAHIGGDLDVRSASFIALDLSGATVIQEFRLAGEGFVVSWQQQEQDNSALVLRNTQVAALQDSPDAWPPRVELEGFKYERLGGFGGEGSIDVRRRTSEQWRNWLERDHTFSTQPYTQLANVLLTAGHRDTAEAIQFAGRERERGEVLERRHWLSWIWLTFLWGVAGYGIGLYTFRVLWWVLGLTVLGAVVLWYSPYARSRGVLWRLGASLHRLLPIVELNKEFKDFFDNAPPTYPGGVWQIQGTRPNLNRFQVVFFSWIALMGWILAFFLAAAMSGLTPKS